ncbi:MAG: cation diffusion facilitator family transporter [Candidatus Omnitrophota bacterium]|jgi:cation diffusion facilitator family transporter
MPWPKEVCIQCSDDVVAWTLVGEMLLTLIAFGGWIASGSAGLLADAFQSLGVFISMGIITLGAYIAKKRPNTRFFIGNADLEVVMALTAFSIMIGFGLFVVGDSLGSLLNDATPPPSIIGLPFATLSLFLTHMIHRYNSCTNNKLAGTSRKAAVIQVRSDFYASIAVFLGILITFLLPDIISFDHMAALFIGVLILKDGIQNAISNINLLIQNHNR